MTVNFNTLKKLYLSKNISDLEELKKVCLKCKFLDSSVDLSNQRIVLASFPRTGNTFLRTFMEQSSGVFTGSDMPLEFLSTL